jgi:hypothetical protein
MYVYILMQGLDAAAKGYMQEAMSEEGVFLLILRWCYCVGSWDYIFWQLFFVEGGEGGLLLHA